VVPDARTAAMGAAFCAVADDVDCLHYNPAGLALINHIEISVSQNQLFQNMHYQHLGIAYSLRDVRTSNLADLGTIGAAFSYLDAGKITGRDATGAENGVFSPRDRIETFAYGKTLFSNNTFGTLRAGAAVKFATQEVKSYNFQNSAFDAGLLWQVPVISNVNIGAAIQNLGASASYIDAEFDLPQTVRAGASYKTMNDALLLDVDVDKPNYSGARYHMGGEYYFLQSLIFRAGYVTGSDQGSGLTAGFGMILDQVDVFFIYARQLRIDYAFIPYGDLGDTHRISIVLKLGAD
jgi:hypothetical protein